MADPEIDDELVDWDVELEFPKPPSRKHLLIDIEGFNNPEVAGLLKQIKDYRAKTKHVSIGEY